jgi:hypothetical protein
MQNGQLTIDTIVSNLRQILRTSVPELNRAATRRNKTTIGQSWGRVAICWRMLFLSFIDIRLKLVSVYITVIRSTKLANISRTIDLHRLPFSKYLCRRLYGIQRLKGSSRAWRPTEMLSFVDHGLFTGIRNAKLLFPYSIISRWIQRISGCAIGHGKSNVSPHDAGGLTSRSMALYSWSSKLTLASTDEYFLEEGTLDLVRIHSWSKEWVGNVESIYRR